MTQNVPKDTILLSYLGVLKAHYEVLASNDCIFSFGVVRTLDPTALVIDSVEYGNAGRFINTADSRHVNCRAERGMFTPRIGPPDPAVIIITTKAVPAGHELFFSYGKLYGKFVDKYKK